MFVSGYANTENVFYCLNIYTSRIFENIPQNGPEHPHRNLATGHCSEEKYRGLAVLVGIIVKLSA